MEWLKRLRAQSIKKALIPFLLLTAAAAALFILSEAWRVFELLSPKTLAELTPETAEGAYVDDTVYFLYGDFIEVERYRNNRPTGVITGRYYLIDFDPEIYYMGLSVHQEDLEGAETMMDACNDFLDGTLDASQVPSLHVRGTIRAMDEEELGYYYDIAEGDEEFKSVLLPIYLDVGRIGSLDTPALVIILVMCAVLLGLGLYFLISACSGAGQKQVREKLAASGSFELEAEKAARFYEETEPVCGVRMGREFVYFLQGSKSVLLRPWDIAWAYQNTTQHRTNGIPSGKTFSAVLRTMDGKSYQIGMSQQDVQKLLQAMETALPGTVLGYSKELEQLYNTNRAVFSARWEEKVPGCTGRDQAPPPPQPVM